MPLISPNQLAAQQAKGQRFLTFDCRHNLFDPPAGRAAHKEAHLPGAYFLHLDEDLSGPIIAGQTGRHPLPAKQAFIQLMENYGLTPATQVVVYDDKGGGIAARLWWMLHWIGHENVSVLDGGIQAWEAAGFELETTAPPAPEKGGTYPERPTKTIIYDRIAVDKIRQNVDYTLIDSRTSERYSGEHEPVDPIAGHIDGAVNYPWPENLLGGKMRDNTALNQRFATLKSKPENTVFYCGSGVTACHNLLAYYRATGKMAALYPGSWSEWIGGGTR